METFQNACSFRATEGMMALAFLTAIGGILMGGYLLGIIALGLILSALVDDALGELKAFSRPSPARGREQACSPIFATPVHPASPQEPLALQPVAISNESRT